MKRTLPIVLMAALACAGCATRYDMKLTDGSIISSKGKPRVDPTQHVIYFKDALGRTNSIPEFRVVELAPHSQMVKDTEVKQFNPMTKK
ncbi:MAG TPA: YgdI/YgdR family lipoprotein [Verrucomicrobiae bacterium]|nr:YgdI/YgdR family lipoprotein [Verrucomicrobiae bacterium]